MYKRMNANDFEIMFGVEIPNYDGCFGKGRDGVTEKQRTFIHSLGMNISGLKYKGQACVVIDCIMKRKEEGLASVKQIQTIRNLKAKTPKPVYELTKAEATEVLRVYLGV